MAAGAPRLDEIGTMLVAAVSMGDTDETSRLLDAGAPVELRAGVSHSGATSAQAWPVLAR